MLLMIAGCRRLGFICGGGCSFHSTVHLVHAVLSMCVIGTSNADGVVGLSPRDSTGLRVEAA
jgi:hypothetical protein